MSKPLFEYEADFINDLKPSTGRTFQEWLSLIEICGLEERPAIRDWLQEEHGLDYMTAHKLSHLKNEDQKLNGPKVTFIIKGRSGNVQYQSKEGGFTMEWEMGIKNIIAIIDLPAADQWEKVTRIPLEKRESVLHFIGQKVVEQETHGLGNYEINENTIYIKL